MLLPSIDRKGQQPVYMQIRNYIIDEIKAGRLEAEDRLPSVRAFADLLGVSCTTIENAYNQLTAEGYITSSQGRGYFVEKLDFIDREGQKKAEEKEEKVTVAYAYDFAREYIEPAAFDFNVWKRHLNYVINYDWTDLCAYGDIRGEKVLREAIARHFYRSRGVHTSPGQIVVGGGVTPLLTMLGNLFKQVGIQGIALENPGFKKAYGVFEASDLQVMPLNIREKGLSFGDLSHKRIRSCYVSPSHHFPTGFIMPVNERHKILRWASAVDGYVIEDDYNFELRFEGQPIPAMQGMDRGERVIYLGSFSTVLAPAIRISFMVLPHALNTIFEASEAMFPQTASKVEQLALARFIDSGDFDRHVKKVRKYYMKKQQQVLEALEEAMPKTSRTLRVKSGLQILVRLPEGVSEEKVVEACRKRSVNVEGLGKYLFDKDRKGHWGEAIVISYRGIAMKDIREGIQRIALGVEEAIGVEST